MEAFERVDQARRGVPLTYFEFGTLAALQIFAEAEPELALLEVGLGGRLDAVNIVDADVAVITSVGLDHQAWLGMDRESIGAEKAGIVRSGRPLVLGEPDPPRSVMQIAEQRRAPVHAVARDWWLRLSEDGWRVVDDDAAIGPLPYGPLRGALIRNAGCAIRAMSLAGMRIEEGEIAAAIEGLSLPGRLQTIGGPVEWVFDLAHNVQGAQMLAETLASAPRKGVTRAVFGMLADKDISGVVETMRPQIDEWLVTGLQGSRGAAADEVASQAASTGVAHMEVCEDVAEACRMARDRSVTGDRVVVFGSFYLVGPAMRAVGLYSPPTPAKEDQIPSS